MPKYKDATGKEHTIANWPGASFKARVINRAYRRGEFWVETILGHTQIFFRCSWCGRLITSAGVQGDHIAPQSSSSKLKSDALLNLAMSCSECNGGSRNQSVRKTRGDYRRDRDAQGVL